MRRKHIVEQITEKNLSDYLLFLLHKQNANPTGPYDAMSGDYLVRALGEMRECFRLTEEEQREVLILLHTKGAIMLEIEQLSHRFVTVKRILAKAEAKAFLFDVRAASRADRRSKYWDILKMVFSGVIGSAVTLLVTSDAAKTLFQAVWRTISSIR